MMLDLISIDSVENLESHTLTSVLNALLTAEADYRNVPLIDLDLTLRTNDPDAGIDGRINWPEDTKHDVLAPGWNVVQYKSGELTPRQLVKEFDTLGRGRHGHRRPARFSTPQRCREQDRSASDLSMHRKIIA